MPSSVRRVFMPYFGGQDDREALEFAANLSCAVWTGSDALPVPTESPGIQLHVMRIPPETGCATVLPSITVMPALGHDGDEDGDDVDTRDPQASQSSLSIPGHGAREGRRVGSQPARHHTDKYYPNPLAARPRLRQMSLGGPASGECGSFSIAVFSDGDLDPGSVLALDEDPVVQQIREVLGIGREPAGGMHADALAGDGLAPARGSRTVTVAKDTVLCEVQRACAGMEPTDLVVIGHRALKLLGESDGALRATGRPGRANVHRGSVFDSECRGDDDAASDDALHAAASSGLRDWLLRRCRASVVVVKRHTRVVDDQA
nr:hypothetical protein HK105_007281 [Polyrhizophydium stewartii]